MNLGNLTIVRIPTVNSCQSNTSTSFDMRHREKHSQDNEKRRNQNNEPIIMSFLLASNKSQCGHDNQKKCHLLIKMKMQNLKILNREKNRENGETRSERVQK